MLSCAGTQRTEDLILPEGVREGFQLMLLLSLKSQRGEYFEAVAKSHSNMPLFCPL